MTPRRSIRTAAFVIAAGFSVVACGSSDTADDDTAAEPTPTQTADAPSADVGPAPSSDVPALLQFTSPLVGGGELDAATLAGTPTAFWFWAPT